MYDLRCPTRRIVQTLPLSSMPLYTILNGFAPVHAIVKQRLGSFFGATWTSIVLDIDPLGLSSLPLFVAPVIYGNFTHTWLVTEKKFGAF